jgi:hypothetical protein
LRWMGVLKNSMVITRTKRVYNWVVGWLGGGEIVGNDVGTWEENLVLEWRGKGRGWGRMRLIRWTGELGNND